MVKRARITANRLLVAVLVLLASPSLLAVDIQVQGLFRGTAVLVIDGHQRILTVGKRSPEGVLLVSADTHAAEVEYEGRHLTLALSRRITTVFEEPETREVSIRRNDAKQYVTRVNINGKRVTAIVDTGANAVILNGNDADRLGLDYRAGTPARVQTASGIKDAYAVELWTVDVGGIVVRSVAGFVIEGAFPPAVLLGMTYLEHVGMREEDGILYLRQKY